MHAQIMWGGGFKFLPNWGGGGGGEAYRAEGEINVKTKLLDEFTRLDEFQRKLFYCFLKHFCFIFVAVYTNSELIFTKLT